VLKERAIYDAFQDEETGCSPSSSSQVLLSISTSTSMVPMQTQPIRCNDPPADSDDALMSEECVINNGMDPPGDDPVDDLMALSGSRLVDDVTEDEVPISGPTEEHDGLHINATDDYKDDDDIDDAAGASDSTKRIDYGKEVGDASSDRRRSSISPCSSRNEDDDEDDDDDDDDDDEDEDAAVSLSIRVLKERMKQARFSLEGRYKEMLVMPILLLVVMLTTFGRLLSLWTMLYSSLLFSTPLYSTLLLATEESSSAVDRSARVRAAAHVGGDPLSHCSPSS